MLRADPAAAAAAGATQRDGWGYLAMACVYLNAFIICATWQGITWTYCSEIFPLDIRMLCVSVTTGITWLGSFAIARSTPYMITALGYGTFFFFGAIVVCMGSWAFLFVPETKGEHHTHTCRSLSGIYLTDLKALLWKKWTPYLLSPPSLSSGPSFVVSQFSVPSQPAMNSRTKRRRNLRFPRLRSNETSRSTLLGRRTEDILMKGEGG